MTVRTPSTPPAAPTDAQALDAWAAGERPLDAGRIAVRTPPPDPATLARRLRTETRFAAPRGRRA